MARARGELGLCGARYATWAERGGIAEAGAGGWQSSIPSAACLERVSACVLARVNAVEASVVFSLRGDGMSLLDQVSVETRFRENHGTAIASFGGCDAACLWGDPLARNCDWTPRFVGRCVRGTLADERAAPPVGCGRPRRATCC